MEKRQLFYLLAIMFSSILLMPCLCDGSQPLMSVCAEGEQRVCLDCHRFPNINTNEGVIDSRAFCLECHSKKGCNKKYGSELVSLRVSTSSFGKSPHRYVACIQCHVDVASLPHKSERGAQCLSCHHVHGQKKLHDPHLRATCQACHHMSPFVTLDPSTKIVMLSHFNEKGHVIPLTNHTLTNVHTKKFCSRCHFRDNKVGAPAVMIPSKGIICMVCHNSPATLGTWWFGISLALFGIGIVISILFWLKGKVGDEEESLHRKVALVSERVWDTIFSREILGLLRVFFQDIILQRKLLQESVRRWALHSLIYSSIMLRLTFSLFSLVVFNLWPHSALAVILIDKNHPFVAFSYELLGFLIVLGVIWAAISRFITKPAHVVSEFQDNIALLIIGVLVILGFIVEGVRIVMAHVPVAQAQYSFIGYPISLMLSNFAVHWQNVYGYLWYAHALVGALLIAYLPYGKMKHIISAPLNLMIAYKDE